MTILVEQAALIMSVQDQGRRGYLRFGLPESGPMDWWAFRAANILVNNPPECACLEVGFSTAKLTMEKEGLIAVCGAGYQIMLNGRQIPLWMSFYAHPGDKLLLQKTPGGNWVYLALSGGIVSQAWLGSRSVYPRGGCGQLLKEGDQIPFSTNALQSSLSAGRFYPEADRPQYAQEVTVGVIPGPQLSTFKAERQELFWSQPFSVTSRLDRMGYRLQGPRLLHQGITNLVSQGMVMGEVQVPPDGQPIVMMPDHPTTGGYPSIGVICRVDQPLFAQAQPMESQVHFRPIDVKQAQYQYKAAIKCIDGIETTQEDQWMHL